MSQKKKVIIIFTSLTILIAISIIILGNYKASREKQEEYEVNEAINDFYYSKTDKSGEYSWKMSNDMLKIMDNDYLSLYTELYIYDTGRGIYITTTGIEGYGISLLYGLEIKVNTTLKERR